MFDACTLDQPALERLFARMFPARVGLPCNWAQAQVGMTRGQVRRVLGRPRKSHDEDGKHWDGYVREVSPRESWGLFVYFDGPDRAAQVTEVAVNFWDRALPRRSFRVVNPDASVFERYAG